MPLTIQPPKPPEEFEEKKSKQTALQAKEAQAPAYVDAAKAGRRIQEDEKFLKERDDEIGKREQILKLKEEAYQKEIQHLDDQRGKLDEEIKERRSHLQDMERDLEGKQELLWEKEKTLGQKEKLLKETGILKDSYLQSEIAGLRRKVEVAEKAPAVVEKKSAEQKVSRIKEALRQKEELLEKKEAVLKNYELSLRSSKLLESQIQLPAQILAEEPLHITEYRQAIKQLEEEKNSLNEDLKLHLMNLSASHLTVQQRQLELDAIKKDLEQKEHELGEKDSRLGEIQGLLQQKEQELDKKEYLLRTHYDSVLSREAEYKNVTEELTGREKELRGQAQMLGQKREIFEQELPGTLEKLTKLREEWQAKDMLLMERASQIMKDKAEIEKMLGKVESDVTLLDKKEKEIVSKIGNLERDKNLVDKEEGRVLQKVKKLEQVEQALRQREGHIQELERTIGNEERRLREEVERFEHAKAIKPELPKIEREYKKLLKRYEAIEYDSVAKRELLKQEESEIEMKKKELEEKDLLLDRKEEQLVQEEYELMHAKESLEKGMFEDYVHQQIRASIETPRSVTYDTRYSKIYALIDKARGHIAGRALDDAKQIIDAIEFEMQNMQEADRKAFVYDVMELKTDMKLASL